MRVKKTKKPARSIRYLLSANAKLQRLSLKRLSARGKPARKRPRASRPKEVVAEAPLAHAENPMPAPANIPAKPPMATAPWGVALVVVAVTAAAVLMAARQTGPDSERPKIEARLDVPSKNQPVEISRDKKPAPAQASTPPVIQSAITKTPAAESPSRADSFAKVESPARAESAPRPQAAESAAPGQLAAHPELTPHTQSDVPKADAHAATRVTITGCLAFDDQTFWLKNTEGNDAPKSRSWRSGFLKKRSSSVELVDAGHSLQLPRYVGQRVSATGTLADREMRALSLQRVGSSCS